MTSTVLAVLLVVGCSDGADPEPPAPSTSEAASSPAASGSGESVPTPGDTAAEESEESEDTEASETEESEQASASPAASVTPAAALLGTQSLAIEQRHPNGSVLRVTRLTVEPTAIRIELEVVNGSGRAFGLAAGGGVVSLFDDRGGVYEFIEPTDNPDLEIEARGTLSGELVYFGVLTPEASTLRLQTNASTLGSDVTRIYNPATESANEPFPHFSVEIPLAP